jgi:hypothetical protein
LKQSLSPFVSNQSNSTSTRNPFTGKEVDVGRPSFNDTSACKLATRLEKNLHEALKIDKKDQTEMSFDGLTDFVYRTRLDHGVANADLVSRNIKGAVVAHPNWKQSENARCELASE